MRAPNTGKTAFALPKKSIQATATHLIYDGNKVSALAQLRSERVGSLPLLRALKQEWPCDCHCCEYPRCSQPSHQLQQLHPHRTS